MESDNRQEALTYLLDLSAAKGYVIINDIMECADRWSLPIPAVDWLSSSITTLGILVYDESPSSNTSSSEDAFDDYAQTDYEEVFKKVIQLDDSLKPFIADIRAVMPPQHKEISQLKHQVREGNAYARKRMIEMHLRMAVRIALKRAETYDMEIVEAIGYACVGLITAVDRYNPDTSDAFAPYASLWMLQSLSREQPTKNPQIYYPAHKKEGYFTVYPDLKRCGCLECDSITQCTKTREMICEKLGCANEQAEAIIAATTTTESLETFLKNTAYVGEKQWYNKQKSDTDVFTSDFNIDTVIEDRILKNNLGVVLKTLTDKEREVLIARYGLDGNKEKTLEEVGIIFRVTRERIRQIEGKALKKLRHSSRSRKLKDFY